MPSTARDSFVATRLDHSMLTSPTPARTFTLIRTILLAGLVLERPDVTGVVATLAAPEDFPAGSRVRLGGRGRGWKEQRDEGETKAHPGTVAAREPSVTK